MCFVEKDGTSWIPCWWEWLGQSGSKRTGPDRPNWMSSSPTLQATCWSWSYSLHQGCGWRKITIHFLCIKSAQKSSQLCPWLNQQNKSFESAPENVVHWPIPVGESHHDVQWSQTQHEVEEGVAVLNRISLIVFNTPWSIPILKISAAPCRGVIQHHRVVGGQGQLVHLGVVGGADAAFEKANSLELWVSPWYSSSLGYI